MEARRIALITGATRGIGRATALQLAKDGCFVVINYRSDHEGAVEALKLIEAAGGQGEISHFDISDAAAVKQAVRDIDKRLGTIDVLVNNAAYCRLKPLVRLTEEEILRSVMVNVAGMQFCSQAVVKTWAGKKCGSRIVNLTSIGADNGATDSSIYCATKASAMGLTKALAHELGPKGVTVNCISPGLIETEAVEQNGIDKERIVPITPLRRPGQPEEVAHLISFLVSERAAFITGQLIRINGGLAM